MATYPGPPEPFFEFVTPRLATGAAITDEQDVAALKSAGVTHVIDCRCDFNDAQLLGPSFIHRWNGIKDDGKHPKPASWLQCSVEFALPALASPRARVYAHCDQGDHRGPSTAYAVMRALGWESTTAREMIMKARPGADPIYADDADAALAELGYIDVVRVAAS
jgi:hypothetical protein